MKNKSRLMNRAVMCGSSRTQRLEPEPREKREDSEFEVGVAEDKILKSGSARVLGVR